jgi:hypothetical protein
MIRADDDDDEDNTEDDKMDEVDGENERRRRLTTRKRKKQWSGPSCIGEHYRADDEAAQARSSRHRLHQPNTNAHWQICIISNQNSKTIRNERCEGKRADMHWGWIFVESHYRIWQRPETYEPRLLYGN